MTETARAQEINDLIEESVYGPGGELTGECANAWVDDRPARAAIRAQAAWLRDRGGYPWAWVAQVLEKEADR